VWYSEGPGSGITADGNLVANGTAMIGFRVQDHAAAWSSTDGRHWTSISMEGNPYDSPDAGGGRPILTPVGILWRQSNGATWLGALVPG
jgi:hypothetical protein